MNKTITEGGLSLVTVEKGPAVAVESPLSGRVDSHREARHSTILALRHPVDVIPLQNPKL